jgi:molybdopterin converting factor small subunit
MLDVPDGSTVGELTKCLGIPPGLDRVILLNGREAEPAEPLRPGDVIDIFPPLAGGAVSVR